jgi:ABC-type nitrate/sulfonate/bicarbonate transport system substrate-binding protein
MRGPLVLKRTKILLMIVCAVAGLPALALAAESQGRTTGSATKIRLGTPVPSLSYLPIYVALKKGFFAKRGFDRIPGARLSNLVNFGGGWTNAIKSLSVTFGFCCNQNSWRRFSA